MFAFPCNSTKDVIFRQNTAKLKFDDIEHENYLVNQLVAAYIKRIIEQWQISICVKKHTNISSTNTTWFVLLMLVC